MMADDLAPGQPGSAQLALPLALAESATFANFLPVDATAAAAHARALAEGQRDDLLWYAGPPGSGKTHLLQAACRAAHAAGQTSMYLPLSSAAAAPALLTGLEPVGLLALDDVDAVPGNAAFERALFDVLNGHYLDSRRLLLAGRLPPAELPFSLPDLQSRAAGAVVYRLALLDDDGLLSALQMRAQARGLRLDEAAARFLLQRIRRDPRSVLGWLDRLDVASLAAGKRLTIPFIRDLLAQWPAGQESPGS